MSVFTIGMLAIKFGFVIVFLLSLIISTHAQRRITNGQVVQSAKRYVVYLLKAPVSPQKYDAWLCGGALVSPEFIVTSAACVEDVQHLYAIAGYNKYIPYEMVQLDPCTREKKKKVIFICVPKGYDLVYERLEKWSYIDIAVVKVESPFDFHDTAYEQLCSYTPGAIAVNYEHRYQEPGVDTLTFGWGHADIWRSPNDATNHNQEDLHYASALIQDKRECKAIYQQFQHNMDNIIDKYMICTMEPGNLNDAGELLKHVRPQHLLEGCVTRMQRMKGMKGVPCYEPHRESNLYGMEMGTVDETRRKHPNISETYYRRNGICQNDHGGPLVTWVGSREVLIGVASVFRVDNESKCGGPYLYTSTQCNGAFLDCILNSKDGRRDSCDAPPAERGFDMYEKQISWVGHPDGPADNEILQQRDMELQSQRSKQPLRTKQTPEHETVEGKSAERIFSDLQMSERQSSGPQLPGRQLPERSLPGRQLPGQQLSGRQLTGQQLPGIQLPGQQFPGQQLPGRQLPERQMPWQQMPEQLLQERQLRENQLRNQQLWPLQMLEQESAEQKLQEQQLQSRQLQEQQFQEQQLREQQFHEQQFQGQQLREQQFHEQQFQGQQLREQQLQEQQFQEQQLREQQFQEQQFQEQQLREQQLQEQQKQLPNRSLREQQFSEQFQEQQFQEEQLQQHQLQEQRPQFSDQPLREQQFSEQQFQEQQLQEQQSQEQRQLFPDRSLREQEFSEPQLPELLSELKLPGRQLPHQASDEQEFQRDAYIGEEPSEEQIGPFFKSSNMP